MQYQKSSAIGGAVLDLMVQFDTIELPADIIAQHFIMIAGYIDDASALPGFLDHLPDQLIIKGRPVPAGFHFPDVDNIANQIKIIAFHMAQKIQQICYLRITGPQMYIGDPNTSEFESGHSGFTGQLDSRKA